MPCTQTGVTHPLRLLTCALIALMAMQLFAPGKAAASQSEPPSVVYFPVTGHHVAEPFLSTWRANGGLPIFGYPLSELIEVDGMQVQYFERARFELHPENAGTEYEVLLTLLGSWLAGERTNPAYTPFPADTAPPTEPGRQFFPETGHYLAYGFRDFWQAHGGLRAFGYPISEEFSELNPDTSVAYTVQYFERARFEYHPEQAGTNNAIMLGRIGAQRATADAIETAAVARIDGVPDYDESLWTPPPAEPRALSIPVLMYHRFGDYAEHYQMPYWSFEQQLDWLQANGYQTVTLTQVYDYMAGIGSLPDRPVVITLDDGYVSQWEAAEALNQRGMVGVFFITTGQPHLADWQIRALADAGHEIGAHTFSHPDLTTLSDDQLAWELTSVRAELQAASGQPVNFFAYPYGAYDARVIAATQAAGYRGALAAWGGSWWSPDTPWTEPRIEVSGFLSLDGFVALVR
jgi:peptidoglycan/xylan/chitin deacetylase (PgdA/CDA1 family)